MEEEAVGKNDAGSVGMEEGGGGGKKDVFDPAWEFAAPKYYDFCVQEDEEDRAGAEFWFTNAVLEDGPRKAKPVGELLKAEIREEDMEEVVDFVVQNEDKENREEVRTAASTPGKSIVVIGASEAEEDAAEKMDCVEKGGESKIVQEAGIVHSTPPATQDGVVRGSERKPFSVMHAMPSSPGSVPAKRLHPEGWTERDVPQTSAGRRNLSGSRKKEHKAVQTQSVRTPATPDDPATKKQKLEGGRLRQIKESLARHHDSHHAHAHAHHGVTKPQEFNFCTEKRSRLHVSTEVSSTMQVSRPISPFVSMAEKVLAFQCKTPERFHLNPAGHHEMDDHEKRKMKLTKPKTPDLETSQRVRQVKVKSTAEMEEEMLAKMPKFRARPVPKKILESPQAFPVQKSIPPAPEFHEFHFRTTERAQQQKAMAAGQHRLAEASDQSHMSISTEPRVFAEFKEKWEPRDGQSATRIRTFSMKTRELVEMDDLAKIPKFKAQPLDRRIFESRGEIGLVRNSKREVTIPEEFHFATDQRIQARDPLVDQLNKMSLHQQPSQETTLRPTVPAPFNLETENRGLMKEMRFLQDLLVREQEDINARVPRARPLPYSTDVPIVPPKPEPKACTNPAPFQLESLVRHEDELQREAEERRRAKRVESALKLFRAQPILSFGPVFVPTRSRKPLTDVHEFTFHSEARAMERADFDEKVTRKHNQYKRFREEYEAARRAEEERSIKAMRREMVPHARPILTCSRPFVPQRSTKELTRPVSPQFHMPQIAMPPSTWKRTVRHSTFFADSLQRKMGQMR